MARFQRGAFMSLQLPADEVDDEELDLASLRASQSTQTAASSSFFEAPSAHGNLQLFIESTDPSSLSDSSFAVSSDGEETLEDFLVFRQMPAAEVLQRRKRTFSTKTVSSQPAPLELNRSLPNTAVSAVKQFLYCFEELRFKHDDDMFTARGEFVLKKSLMYYAAQNKPIEMILPAFPCKSPSRKKVLGVLPDYGEKLSLKRLNSFCASVAAVYPPGCKMVIMGDGRVFADLISVPDETVDLYTDYLKKEILPGFPHLVWEDLDAYMPGATYDEMRLKLTDDYGLDFDEVVRQIRASKEMSFTYAGFARFLSHDRDWAALGVTTKSQVKKRCEVIAKRMIWRNKAFSNLILKHFARHVRLSIHGYNNAGPKFGVRLFGHMPKCVTPWHNVPVVLMNGQRILMHRQTAEQLPNVVLCYKNDAPWCFHELGDDAMASFLSDPTELPCKTCKWHMQTTGEHLRFEVVTRTV